MSRYVSYPRQGPSLQEELDNLRRDFAAVERRLAVAEAGGSGDLRALDAERAAMETRIRAELEPRLAKRASELQGWLLSSEADKRALEALVATLREEVVKAKGVRGTAIAAAVSEELRKVAAAVECSALAGEPLAAARVLKGLAARWSRGTER